VLVLQWDQPDQKTGSAEKSHAFLTSLGKEKKKPKPTRSQLSMLLFALSAHVHMSFPVLPYISFGFRPKESIALQKPQGYTYR